MRPLLLFVMLLCSFSFSFLFSNTSFAVVEGYKYPFTEETDAERFQQLSEDLRCPKCQNQNLADSHAPIAIDMRDKVYELMQEGKEDQEIVDYLVARYGDFVTYKPPFRLDTLLLWGAPIILFVLGAFILVYVRRLQATPAPELSLEEQKRLQAIKKQMQKDKKE